jgi:Protein of unknown function (DUF3152)
VRSRVAGLITVLVLCTSVTVVVTPVRPAAAATGRVGPGETRRVFVADDLPDEARAVMVNVTAVNASRATYLTVWPSGATRPTASNLNPAPGTLSHNVAYTRLGSDGSINIYNSAGTVDVLVDVLAWSADPDLAGEAVPVAPTRLLDTRASTDLGADSTIRVPVTGRAGIPARPIGAAVLNITAVNSTHSSFLTVWPTGLSRPNASSVNPQPGETRHNLVIAPVGADGSVTIYNAAGTTDVLVDVLGWLPTSAVTSNPSRRLLDTRSRTAAGPDSVRTIVVDNARRGDLAVVNLTSTSSTANSYITIWPAGRDRPTISNLNPRPGATVHNLAVVELGEGGAFSMFQSAGSTHLIVDLLLVVSGGLRTIAPTRVLDTRAEVVVPPSTTERAINYQVRTAGSPKADLDTFTRLSAETLASAQGWRRAGVKFSQVGTGGEFTLWLAAAESMASFGSPCNSNWSCRVGRNVIINDDRWRLASPLWASLGLPLRDYQNMVVNHEVGHFLGYGHHSCGGSGQLAPVMQQQSKDLAGCRFNPWPLAWEVDGLSLTNDDSTIDNVVE